MLIACKKLPVDDVQKQVDKKIYYDALYLMNPALISRQSKNLLIEVLIYSKCC